MTLEDTVKKYIAYFPESFRCRNYAESRRKVMDLIFMSGNDNIKYAKDREGNYLGYLIDRNLHNRESPRGSDPEYGTVLYNGEPIEDYFGSTVYSVQVAPPDHRYREIATFMRNNRYRGMQEPYVLERETEDVLTFYAPIADLISLYSIDVAPDVVYYENYRYDRSVLWREGVLSLKQDWKDAVVEHFSDLLIFVNSDAFLSGEERWTAGKFRNITRYYSSYGTDRIERIRRDYDVPVFDGENYEESVEYMNTQRHLQAHSFLRDTIELLTVPEAAQLLEQCLYVQRLPHELSPSQAEEVEQMLPPDLSNYPTLTISRDELMDSIDTDGTEPRLVLG